MSGILMVYPQDMEGYEGVRDRVVAASRCAREWEGGDNEDAEEVNEIDEGMWDIYQKVRKCHWEARWAEIRKESLEERNVRNLEEATNEMVITLRYVK